MTTQNKNERFGVFRRGQRYFIETTDGRETIDDRLSRELNDGGDGYSTRRDAEKALAEWNED